MGATTLEGTPAEATRPAGWLARRDPGLRATKRSIRAAVVVPSVFAIAYFGVPNAQTPLFAAFGSVALLLFTDFGGPPRLRLRAYLTLWVTGVVLISVGTVCSTHAVAAVLGMALFGFLVLYAGVVSPQAAVGAVAALLTFVLPVAVPAPPGQIGWRLLGWALAGAVAIPAVMLVWAGRWHDELRHTMATAARALADLARAHGMGRLDHEGRQRVESSLAAMRARFEATPYRPTGAGPSDQALTMLVARLEFLGESTLVVGESASAVLESPGARAANLAAAAVLEDIATVLDLDDPDDESALVDLAAAVEHLERARRAATTDALERLLADPGEAGASTDLQAIDPTYRARMLAFATVLTAEVALRAAAQRGMGGAFLERWRELASPVELTRSAAAGVRGRAARWKDAWQMSWRVATTHLTLRSVWFRNSLRGAAALAAAVTVVECIDVQHGFWVVLGTLSVLRSNALGTGATALRAVTGTVVGFVVGSLILVGLGHHHALLWVVLPLAVLVAGIAPSTISFAAGQAGFTVVVVILFNILDPVGYKVGLVRVEDVAIGAAVSLAVGLLFWPRGATAELARAMSDAYATATAWLTHAVRAIGTPPDPASPERRAAEAAHRRLDDAYRQFLAERGAKQVPLPAVTELLTGSARVRLTALTLDTLPDLGELGDGTPLPAVDGAREALGQAFARSEAWYDGFAEALGHRRVPVPPLPETPPGALRSDLEAALVESRQRGRADGVLASLRLVWAEERLEDLGTLQVRLATSASTFAERSARERRW